MADDIRKAGYMKKLKTMKKKYFVLRDNHEPNAANLTYFDNEKKFKNSSSQPKRVIYLKDCFSINRKIDGKHKYVIALYTKEDSFCTVVEDEEQLKDWLDALIDLQSQGIDFRTGHSIHYQHVWQVTINRTGLGQTRNMGGVHRFCLTASTLFIVKVDPQTDSPDIYEFPLISIRRCGHTYNTFFIELGRSSSIGPGELWIQAGDSAIAQNMHEVILQAMCSSKNNEDFGPSQRPRSASTSDKPISSRRPTQSSHSSQNMAIFGTSYSSTASGSVLSSSIKSSIRDRCDSMPTRSRANSESEPSQDCRQWSAGHYHSHIRNFSYSPPSHNPLGSAASTDSAGSSLSIDDYDCSHSLTPVSEHHSIHNSLMPSEPPISEEEAQTDDYLSMSPMGSSNSARSQLNLNFRSNSTSNTSPITSPTFTSNKATTKSVKEDMSPYMPMSPVGSADSESLASSRRSSGLEKQLNNETLSSSEYMPMMSSQEIKSTTSEEYLSMAPLSQSLSESLSKEEAIASKSNEFHLDKVKSFYPDENDSFDYLPPVRAYSIGSRPQVMRVGSKSKHLVKSGTQTPDRDDSIRIRAFSTGSHSNTREMRVAAKKQQLIEQQIGAPTAPIQEVTRDTKKSSSAPVLSPAQPRKRAATVGSRPIINRAATITDRSDTDLMEIDYSHKTMQSKLKEKLDDRIKRSTAGHRQRSNSRSSTSSSGFGSTSTASPSMTSSMSELTDKKRDGVQYMMHKTADEHNHTNSHSNHRPLHPTSDAPQVCASGQTHSETKLPLSHRPNISQVSQLSPTVPSVHSSAPLQQSQSQKLPTITNSEPIAQTNEENSTKAKTKTYDDSDGDYVCLDIRSTASVPQISSSMNINQTLPKRSQMNDPLVRQSSGNNKSDFVPQTQSDVKPGDKYTPSTPHLTQTVTQTPSKASKGETVAESDAISASTVKSQTLASNKSVTGMPMSSAKAVREQSDGSSLKETLQTENYSENCSSGSGSASWPSSVSSNKELYYASLDLPATSSSTTAAFASECGPQPMSVTPLGIGCGNQELLFSSADTNQLSYAQIDFGIDKKGSKS